MNTRLRFQAVLAATASALVLCTGVQAGPLGDLVREAKGDSDSSSAPAPAPAPRQSAPRQSAPRADRSGERGAAREQSRGESRGERGPIGNVIEGRSPPRYSRSQPPMNNAAPTQTAPGTVVQRRGDRGPIGNVIERNFDRRGGDSGGNYQGGRRPPRYVANLPGGYRQYDWNGRQYYNHDGHWYRPYGSRYVVVGAPFGLFVNYLPGYYSSFWFGSTRYFYADDNYYTYEPARRGYVVTRSPYGDDRDDEDSQDQDQDLYVYPAKGQSEQQQADDRYDCHRWAADQTHYDPVDSTYDADQRADYLRAMTACLTGRGYSVK
jgi:hypothetical protein